MSSLRCGLSNCHYICPWRNQIPLIYNLLLCSCSSYAISLCACCVASSCPIIILVISIAKKSSIVSKSGRIRGVDILRSVQCWSWMTRCPRLPKWLRVCPLYSTSISLIHRVIILLLAMKCHWLVKIIIRLLPCGIILRSILMTSICRRIPYNIRMLVPLLWRT